MKKSFLVSTDIKIFIVLRSILTGALTSLLIFFLYFFLSKDLLIPVLFCLLIFNSWLAFLTIKKVTHLSVLGLSLHDSHLEFRTGSEIKKVLWKEINRIEMSYTPIGGRNTFIIFTKDKSYPIHIYNDFNFLWFQISERLNNSANMVSKTKIWGKEMQLLMATIFSFLILVALAMLVVQPTDFSFMYFVILAAGLFFILYRPFSQLITEAITQAEVGLGTICILAFIFHFTATLLLPYLQRDQSAQATCGVQSPQVICYRTQPETCKRLWTQLGTTCKEDLKSELQSRSPSSLVGPIISRCQRQKFDKTLFYSRINADSSICQSYFGSLEKIHH